MPFLTCDFRSVALPLRAEYLSPDNGRCVFKNSLNIVYRAHIIQSQPFNSGYEWFNTTENMIIPNLNISAFNTYIGGQYQQASSVITTTSKYERFPYACFAHLLCALDQECYETTGQCFGNYGLEYKPGE